jgi:hypothetical protein
VQGEWLVDHALAQGNEAVIEWTMRWTPTNQQKPQLVRGAEWYVFREHLIYTLKS